MPPTARLVVAALLMTGAVLFPAGSGAAQLPERQPPAGFASVNGANGGRTLAGTFTGNAPSAAVVLGWMRGALRTYFDGPPVVSGAVGDPGDPGIMAFFDARLHGAPVSGVALVQRAPSRRISPSSSRASSS